MRHKRLFLSLSDAKLASAAISMLDEIIAILILMVMGGGIAYLGDTLGLKLGKKRLSLFGLRPRTTASWIGAGTGALTALLTFVVLLGLDRGFRIAVQHGAQLVESNYHLSTENRTLRKRSAQEQAAADQAVRAATQAQTVSGQAQSAADQARQDARAAHAGVARAQKQLAGARASLQAEQAAVTAAEGKLGSVQQQLASTRGELGAEQRQVAAAQSRSAALVANIAQERKIESGLSQYGLAEGKNALLYRNGEEVGRTRLMAGQPVATIRGQIGLFLTQLSAQALVRGASRGSDGHAVQLPNIAFGTNRRVAGESLPLTFVGEQDNINALADNIHNYTGETRAVALIARAYGNSFAGQTVTVTLNPYTDRQVLTAGQVIAHVTLPPSNRTYDGITQGIMRLLQSAKQNAIRQGVIPVVINPSTNETQTGDVPFSTLYDIVDQVRRMPAAQPVTVSASAAEDTWSVGPLRLSFAVAGGDPANGSGSPVALSGSSVSGLGGGRSASQ